MQLAPLDHQIIHFFRKVSIPAARIALFVVFFWFGLLKLIGLSPAGPIVHTLFDATLAWAVPFDVFYLFFSLLECVIGILFVIPRAERIAMPLLLFHMGTTFLPLIFMYDTTFSAPFVPTLEGQYIIKNLVIIAAALGIAAHLHPLPRKR